jgi:hypothetical protein
MSLILLSAACKCIHHSDQWSYSDIKVSSDTHKWRAFRIFYLLFYNFKQIKIIMIQRTIVINTIKYINDQPSCCFFMCIRFKPINFFSQLRAILDFAMTLVQWRWPMAMTVTPLTKISHRSLCFRSFCGDLCENGESIIRRYYNPLIFLQSFTEITMFIVK